jgi:hypothetical protein
MASVNAGINTSSASFLFGSGTIPQVLLALVAGLVLFITLYSFESLVVAFNGYANSKSVLVPNTSPSSSAIVVVQDPKLPDPKMILASDNERTGYEFTYSFFLYVDPATMNTAGDTVDVLKQVFYKGYSKPFPLLGPGVFVRSSTNTMRVFMNSYKSWYSYVDIPNIPLAKWFHTAIVFRANNLEVYVNGNMAGRISMESTAPYQNYENLVIFGGNTYDSTEATKYKNQGTGDAEKFKVGPAIIGQISRLSYYRYALSFSEIQANVNEGPSSQIDLPAGASPGSFLNNTLTDSWYTAGSGSPSATS